MCRGGQYLCQIPQNPHAALFQANGSRSATNIIAVTYAQSVAKAAIVVDARIAATRVAATDARALESAVDGANREAKAVGAARLKHGIVAVRGTAARIGHPEPGRRLPRHRSIGLELVGIAQKVVA